MDLRIAVLVLCALFGKAVGRFRCYACSFSSVDSDQSCLTIGNNTNIVECPFTYCTITRQEFIDPIGVIASFTRGCESFPDFLNHEVTDPTFRTFYRACTNDLCNIGDGIQSIVGGNLSPYPAYTGINLLVPGTGSGVNIKMNRVLFFSVIMILIGLHV
ncbi:uncharacterized protein LOC114253220 [Bombyx mandarina]|uniref:Uncharacterized protein n=2 Tax=Bombyx TaxID=7090 RepID=A0A8R2AI58_BOMMO|nr:uncharacterized protein LOC101746422 [Bombyx mori]XP_028043815.1 uncharacterized protein LOC114253220 [Bombyx mandarina]